MKTGISLYFSNPLEQNEHVVERAAAANVSYAFTSFQIPEELGIDFSRALDRLLPKLQRAGISLIADVGPATCRTLGVQRIDNLANLGISHIRLDDGFTSQEAVELSKKFHIVFNASTIRREEIAAWRREGADFSRFSACHNFYPKRNTGLDIGDVAVTDAMLAAQGFEIMGFVPTDDPALARGPVYEGLPTVEAHRGCNDLAISMLELAEDCACDIVIVGDPDVSEVGWTRLAQISHGYVDLCCHLKSEYENLYGQVHHDRPDSSRLIFRSQESRRSLKHATAVDATAGAPRPAGSIAVSNSSYARYEGELEIARVDLEGDARMNVVGVVVEQDLPLLQLARNGFGIRIVPEA